MVHVGRCCFIIMTFSPQTTLSLPVKIDTLPRNFITVFFNFYLGFSEIVLTKLNVSDDASSDIVTFQGQQERPGGFSSNNIWIPFLIVIGLLFLLCICVSQLYVIWIFRPRQEYFSNIGLSAKFTPERDSVSLMRSTDSASLHETFTQKCTNEYATPERVEK